MDVIGVKVFVFWGVGSMMDFMLGLDVISFCDFSSVRVWWMV